jgi:drug/metabolite transporter (DMT)-like permease
MDITTLGELAAIGTAFLWTLSALSWTSAGKHIGALPVSFIRMLIACVYLSIYGLIVRRMALPLDADADTWLVLGVSGFFGFFIADVCLFKAFLLIGPRISLLVQTLSPPLAQIIAWIFINDKIGLKDCLGMAVTLIGVFWVVMEQPETEEEGKRGQVQFAGTALRRAPTRSVGCCTNWTCPLFRRGLLLASISAVAGAVGAVLSKLGIGSYDAVSATYIRVIGAIVGYVGLVTILRRWPMIVKGVKHGRSMSIMAFGCFVGPFAGVSLFMVALRYCHVGVVTTIVNTMPVLILPLLIIFYHEKVSIRAAGGAILSVVGVAIMVL